MKKIVICLSVAALLCCSGCSNHEVNDVNTAQTGDILSGQTVEIESQNIGLGGGENGSGQGFQNPVYDSVLSGNKNSQVQQRFSEELCNKIIAFDLCVISKAPIENQPVMKKNLEQVLQSWKLLANVHLREVCQDVILKDTFQEVVKHYSNLENGCSF